MHKLLSLIFIAILAVSCHSGLLINIQTTDTDGDIHNAEAIAKYTKGYYELRIPVENLQGLDTLTIFPSFAVANPGDEGFFLDPQSMMCYFTEGREEGEAKVYRRANLPIVGINTPSGRYLSIFESYRFNILYKTIFRDGQYSLSQSLILKATRPSEDFVVRYYPLSESEATYSGMGRLYRKIKVVDVGLKTLKERAAERPELKYAIENPEIRIRQCWKPVPTKIEHQTLENEPEPKVRVTFKRVEDIVDALKDVGVDSAQLTLVGWNIAGHDGRYPTVFPVEPRLGGEKDLRHLIAKAQGDGFQIVPHICTCDSYEVSPDFSWDNVAKNTDGTPSTHHVYGSGRDYDLCYEVAYNKFVLPLVDSLLRIGFKGLCYNDVYSIVAPTMCYDEKHPCYGKEAEEYAVKTLAECAKMGGVASEGGYDHLASVLDFALYVTNMRPNKIRVLKDEYVPLWNVIYNGYIYSCPSSYSINYSIKDPSLSMKVQEYGGHPTFYFYSAHRDDNANWMGTKSSDLLCGTQQELETAASAIKVGYDYLKEYGYLQYETMEDHSRIAPDVYRTIFGNGQQMICNYSNESYEYEGHCVAPQSWFLIK